jgi:ferredoxin
MCSIGPEMPARSSLFRAWTYRQMETDRWLPQIDARLCTGCGCCIGRCPTGALGLQEGKAVLVDPDACYYAAECETACPVGAIALPYQVILQPTTS